jgi:hypothetical protein
VTNLSDSESEGSSPFLFTYQKLEQDLRKAQELGYLFRTISDYYNFDHSAGLSLYLRIDIDFKPSKLLKIVDILNCLDIKATFFVRMLAPEYNPASYGMLGLVKDLSESGHEICLHHEAVDLGRIASIGLKDSMEFQLQLFRSIYGFNSKGVAGHGGITGLNNQTIFDSYTPKDFGLVYEAYDKSPDGIFSNSYYISDSLWHKWKSYDRGVIQSDSTELSITLDKLHKNLYVLIHPDTFYENTPYPELD